ncbi:hypothetical protein IP92_01306 [Pseudoduganella flava]|uniref:ABC transporter permease n=1 Tax=Pseudoduganella flava TaxID=871742 RepID=A0A562Q078_9BURK|nr:hypothetical protein [Pseudoduganella flava]QGZ38379.1 hypothetical protein GO485_04470 [Pseudoduganella flava]TWI50079.1 hypothetical protein IP92_01306 [Pseudoduganella flava]
MNAYRMLLMQPLLERRLRNEMWSTVLLVLFAIAEYVSTLAWSVPRGLTSFLAGVFLAAAVLIWWGVFLQNAVQQNRPSLSLLVPGLRRRLMVLTAVLWIGASLLPALVVGMVLGHFGYVLIGTAFLLLFVALCQRHVLISYMVTVVIVACLQIYREQLVRFMDAVTTWGETTVALGALALMVPLGWLALRILFPHGGDRHFAWGDAAARRASNAKRGVYIAAFDTLGGRPLLRLLDAFYAPRSATPRRPGQSMLDGLGPRTHWSRPSMTIVMITALTLALHAWAGTAKLAPFVPIALALLVLPLWGHARSTLAALKATPVEQGVLLLTPGAPARRELNRELARVLLVRYGITWLAYLACSALIVLLTIGSWNAWACCTALSAMFAPVLLRDHARHPGWNSALLVFGAVMLVTPPLAGIVEHVSVPNGLLPGAVIGALIGTAIALRLRWRKAVAATVAFPAGRLAA